MQRGPFALAVVACVLSSTLASSAQALPSIHIVTLPVDSGAEAFYAADQGFFKNAGLDASIDVMPNGGATIAAVSSGAADIGFSNVFSLAQAFNHGVPITLIAGAGLATQTSPTALVVVDASSPVRTAKDLSGKTFAVDALKSITELAPRAWIDKNGGDSSAVKFLEMPFGEMAVALAQHRVDAALLPEPFLTRAQATVRSIGDAYPAVAKQFLIGAFFTTTTWAKAHPDLLKRFVAAIHETAPWANRNRAQTAAILAKNSKIDAATLGAMRRVMYAETLAPDVVQPVIDIAAKYHVIDSDFAAKSMIYAE
jgi:NitT/TauT family transport system substrate-binding protein